MGEIFTQILSTTWIDIAFAPKCYGSKTETLFKKKGRRQKAALSITDMAKG